MTSDASLAFSTVLPTTVHAAAALPSRDADRVPVEGIARHRDGPAVHLDARRAVRRRHVRRDDAVGGVERMPPSRATLVLFATTASCEPPDFTQIAGPGERKAA